MSYKCLSNSLLRTALLADLQVLAPINRADELWLWYLSIAEEVEVAFGFRLEWHFLQLEVRVFVDAHFLCTLLSCFHFFRGHVLRYEVKVLEKHLSDDKSVSDRKVQVASSDVLCSMSAIAKSWYDSTDHTHESYCESHFVLHEWLDCQQECDCSK